MKPWWLFLALASFGASAQQSARDDAFWRGVDVTPERRKLIEDSMLHGAMAGELGRRMNAVLGNPGPLSAIDEDKCRTLVAALDAYAADPASAPRTGAPISELYAFLDGYHQLYMKLDGMPVEQAKAQVLADVRRDRQHFAGLCAG